MLRHEVRTEKTICPKCESPLANSQGVDTCTCCDWASR